MADGLNTARAMRVGELMTDFRNIQRFMSSIRVSPSAEDYNEEGFRVLRHCVAQSQRMLQQDFASTVPSMKQESDEESAKQQLRTILSDAATKRFHAHKLYLQARAAIRWASNRQKILQGQRPHAGHAQVLAQLQANLRQELLSLSDQRVAALLRHQDLQERKWTAEDPGVDEMVGRGFGVM
ncbi:hypothetical protein CERZMDRAFT_102575 [Cercospora zeae-maydis SCOH1-5]|uniref:Prion-inhibition and propagation HeLo domain-containing protein n=1 Tax=Cercospora zeae-maydis SCOH1-5 TaxID=717836 RepID=A0A6A6F1W9_9PEZI|nr:hypothetical protein CERZMDRAFT_102575 [Cercospora zeae-maydis SCOH1-5]